MSYKCPQLCKYLISFCQNMFYDFDICFKMIHNNAGKLCLLKTILRTSNGSCTPRVITTKMVLGLTNTFQFMAKFVQFLLQNLVALFCVYFLKTLIVIELSQLCICCFLPHFLFSLSKGHHPFNCRTIQTRN